MAALPEAGGTFAGRYRLLAQLAAGGMGAVYEADDSQTGRRVALKLLHPELARDRELHRRFRREASILAALDHPAVVRVADVGSDEAGIPYTAMELLAGETLHARIARRTLGAEELDPVLADACAGLDAVHAHGVIHGDLKPANLFLVDRAAEGVAVKLVDFGLSKVYGLERLTRTGEVIGTPVYMAPELLTGAQDIDRRVDVYSLGVLLYEGLAGRLPFTERNPGRLLFRIVEGRAPPLREAQPGVSPAVAEVVHRAMAPRREERHSSAGELARDFSVSRNRSS